MGFPMHRDNVQIAMGHVPVGQKLDDYFVQLGLGFNAAGLKRAKLREILLLESQSDEALADLGLTRDQILPHVFRDVLVAP